LAKASLDENGVTHLSAIKRGRKLILRLTSENKVKGELKLPLEAEIATFFRDLAIILINSLRR